MIRGKATEYAVLLLLKRVLNPHEWSVAKLNLNAQGGTHDEDVTITHQRTGIIKIECKTLQGQVLNFPQKPSSKAKIKVLIDCLWHPG